MKKLVFATFLLSLFATNVIADNYSLLWKQVEEAHNKDLPKSEMALLRDISSLAKKEGKYGQLLCAELKNITVMTSVSLDSLQPAVSRLVEQEKQAEKSNNVLAAVYQSILGRIYKENPMLGEKHKVLSRDYFIKSLSNPSLLAAHKEYEYVPFVRTGYESRIFDNDLLSILGFEAEDYKVMHKYYAGVNNRPATMMTALNIVRGGRVAPECNVNKSKYIVSLDSLISEYSDLKECGELAIERYNYMLRCNKVNAEDKIRYIHYALGKWGSWPRINILRNEEKKLTQPQFNTNIKSEVSLPDKQTVVKFTDIRNINELTMHVSRLSIDADNSLNPDDESGYKQFKKFVTEANVINQTKRYIGEPVYKLIEDSMVIGKLPVGAYLIEFFTDNKNIKTKRCLYFVSDLFVINQELPGKKIRIAVVSATTGQPIAGAKIKLFSDNLSGNKKDSVMLVCNAKGEVIYQYSKHRPYEILAYTDTDKYYPKTNMWNQFSYYEGRTDADYVNVYTDRAIYRPGQIVHASAIAFKNKGGIVTFAEAGKTLKLTLFDADDNNIESKTVTTDKFGTASADFVLPQNTHSRHFSINSNYGSMVSSFFRVEEYKRPTFEIKFPEINTAYHNGDTLEITAHALSYAGLPVQGAKVNYKVTRRQAFWWWSYGTGNRGDDMMYEGTAITDSKGGFKIDMPMVLPGDVNEKKGTGYTLAHFFNFIATVTVTDLGGESHDGTMSLPLGSKQTAFDCDLPDKIERDSLKNITFYLKNQAGVNIDGNVKYYIDGSYVPSEAKTNKETLFNLNGIMLNSGLHKLTAICENDTIEKKFVIFSLDDTKPCVNAPGWFYHTSNKFSADGKPVYVQIGSSDENTHILYNIISGDSILENGVIDLSNALNTRRFTYKNEYGTGLLVTYAWVKDGNMYSYSTTIERPLPDKSLVLKWITFRDRLSPGQKEEWTLNVSGPGGKASSAQLMASMYDKSLDQFTSHTWSFNPCIYQYMPEGSWRCGSFDGIDIGGSAYYNNLQVRNLSFSKFDDDCFQFWVEPYKMGFVGSVVGPMKSRAFNAKGVNKTMMAEYQDSKSAYKPLNEVSLKSADSNKSESGKDNTNQIRENFNETAFFYPALMADKKGNVSIKFTLPESVTTWKFMALAHDTLMNYGMLDGEAVAKKTVMVQPNMPRFIREGDMASIASKIFNTSQKKVSGSAKMELLDPETYKVVYAQSKPFAVETERTVNVNFELSASAMKSADGVFICRVTVDGKGFRDGEQHFLPVLPAKEMVTKTVAFNQYGPGVKNIDLANLFTVKDANNKLTVEYTNNPIWMMIQTLPFIGQQKDDNAISLVSAYYANKLGQVIMNQSPKIKTTIDTWKHEKNVENNLMSSLMKNQELKDIILNETPWVNDADNETRQKHLLSSFFDESGMQYNISAVLDKLKKLQNADGSWSWWPGMEGSEYITAYVINTIVRLNKMAGIQQDTKEMLKYAFDYMGRHIVKDVEDIKENEKKGIHYNSINNTQLNFLYSCALDGRTLKNNVRDANDYLISILQKMTKEQSLNDKAMAAVIFSKDNISKAKEYIKSLKEYSVYKEDMGRYYDTPRAEYSWCDYRIPTQVAAIEAIKTVTPEDKQTIGEMQCWLLQQKRTQCWDTPINSVNAVYAFLNGDNNVFNVQDKTAIYLNGKKIDSQQSVAGLGYIKAVKIGDDMRTFSANKTSEGTSWGAVYAQFMQNTKDIENYSSGISVKRDIIGDIMSLKVGDKITVRITIKADRDYDFIQVSDRRAGCMEPVNQLSGYHFGYYSTPKDNATNYYFDHMSKGIHVIDTEYYIDRIGQYETGTCTVQSAYSPEYRATAKALMLKVD